MTEQPKHVVRIERTYQAPPEQVFDAWVSPEVLRRWFHCEADWETPVAEVDLRLGGAIRVLMRKPDGSEAGARGIFRLIDRPRRLEMSWTFDDEPANEQLIELRFSSSGDGTAVLMVNSDISGRARRDGQERGWRGCLTELGRLLAE